MYHRFSATPALGRLSASLFEAHIRFIRRHFEPCRLSALAKRLRNRESLPPNLVVVTVDDGYADFREVAYPILQRYGVPATLFVTTRFVDQSIWLWPDRLRYYLEASSGRHVIEIAGARHEIVLADAASRENAWSRLGDACLTLTPTEREQALAALEAALGVRLPPRPTDEFRAITWDQVRELDPTVVEIGCHTCSHPVLSKCSDDELETEVVASKAAIEREIGRPVVSFAYPNGQAKDYDARVIGKVRKAGYENAVVAHGSFVRRGADLLTLERLEPPDEEPEFRKVISGLPDVLHRTTGLLWPLVSW
jgi:peptidoglycan/xylan/chitin deacetylase (PgdA/CDA1 family)